MPEGPSRARLHSLLDTGGREVDVIDPACPPAALDGADAVIHVPFTDPFDCGPGLPGELARLGGLAASAGARMVFCSSCLLYGDLGERENAANDPELDPPAGLGALARAELELFGSGAEVMMLRLGILLGGGMAAASELSEGLQDGRLCVPDDGTRYVPLLDLDELAAALGAVAASRLHGAWDLVSDAAPLADLLDHSAGLLATGRPRRLSPAVAFERAGERLSARWLRSRRVTGEALREAGAASQGDWQAIVRAALA